MKSAATTVKHWWTYQGYRGANAHAMAHATEESALFHHGMATSLGGAFDCAGVTRRPITAQEMLSGLSSKFPGGVEIVNPMK